jgi:hypothetical protein
MNYLYAALAVFLFGGGLYVGRLTVETKTEAAVIKIDAAAIKQDEVQESTDQKAEAQHDKDIESPMPLIIKQPVWLRIPAVCLPLPAPPANPSATPRPVDPGPSRDIQRDLRPALADFAQRYENALSDCRRMSAMWPK